VIIKKEMENKKIAHLLDNKHSVGSMEEISTYNKKVE
jgi:hypothetical protein